MRGDFWAFRTMITPVIIQIIFWIGAIITIIIGIGAIIYGIKYSAAGMGQYLWYGIATVILGPIIIRLYCEILIIFFRINETLTEIEHILLRRPEV